MLKYNNEQQEWIDLYTCYSHFFKSNCSIYKPLYLLFFIKNRIQTHDFGIIGRVGFGKTGEIGIIGINAENQYGKLCIEACYTTSHP